MPPNLQPPPLYPPRRVINLFEETKATTGITQVDLSSAFDLPRIASIYSILPPKKEIKCTVQPHVHHFVFMVNGSGALYTDTEAKQLTQWDCFAFPPSKTARSYTLVGSKEGGGFVIVSDKHPLADTTLDRNPPEFPTIVSSYDKTEWTGTGVHTKKKAVLTSLTDISCTKSSMRQWNVTIECLLPGTQTSYPHAHSEEDEFVVVLAGKARYWYNGEEPEQLLVAGDCAGWKAGTGVAHAILNDADGPNTHDGAVVVLLTFGEVKDNDKLYYPTKFHERQAAADATSKGFWKGGPKMPVGGAADVPRFARTEGMPYPVWESKGRNIVAKEIKKTELLR
ncbi:hypothetical protein CPB86DRAFT_768696 [Serendipita vermifera]|nr:hypothetical protein CPB86DRAFT_768696 [Serendipita vermifera]